MYNQYQTKDVRQGLSQPERIQPLEQIQTHSYCYLAEGTKSRSRYN